ncbi:hypothetical protein N9309_02445 [Acidimicrobiia bacterium]|nr:hypothetical protein [Acidimicrobiia bacterium]
MINFYKDALQFKSKYLVVLKILYFSALNYFVYKFVFINANVINTFEDEIISLASSYSFFTTLNFIAEPLIPGNYGVGLTSGPLSAVGGVAGWSLSKSFIISRISNFYYVVLLQVIFSYLLSKYFKLNFNNLILLSTVQVTLVPWWIGALYGMGEIASTIIFVNSLFLFSKKRQLSLLLFSSSIIYGKFLLAAPFAIFFIADLIFSPSIEKKYKRFIKDLIPISIPFVIWYTLIILKTGFDNFIIYISEFLGFVFVFENSGVESARNISLDLILNQLRDSEVSGWSSASLIRTIVVPILFAIIFLYNKNSINNIFGLNVQATLLSVFVVYLWFWILSPLKYIRHTQHFTLIIIFLFFYCLVGGILEKDIQNIFILSVVSLFFSDLLLILIFNTLIYLIYFSKLNLNNKNIFTNVVFSVFLLSNIIISTVEESSKEKVNLDFPECAYGLALETCYSNYLYYELGS